MELASNIVASYVGNNAIPPGEVPDFIARVHEALQRMTNASPPGAFQGASPEAPVPAVDIAASVAEDYIVCLEDGARLKMLKRYLRTQYGLTPEEYRRKWGLPDNYPMTAPGYSRTRSRLAHEMGLGQVQAPKRERGARPAKAAAGGGRRGKR
jgi:predicted transcriptional regulator